MNARACKSYGNQKEDSATAHELTLNHIRLCGSAIQVHVSGGVLGRPLTFGILISGPYAFLVPLPSQLSSLNPPTRVIDGHSR